MSRELPEGEFNTSTSRAAHSSFAMIQSLSSKMSRLALGCPKLAAPLGPTTVAPAFRSLQKTCLSSLAVAPAPARTIDLHGGADFGATSSLPPLISLGAAEHFAAFVHANRHQKVRPFILKRRREKLRTYRGNERNIRHSPWRLNLVCQFAAGLTVPEALKQLLFCQKVKAPLVAAAIKRTANEASAKDGLQPSQLEVAECFSTHGTHLKRVKIMGRGR